MAALPVKLITHPQPGLFGAAAAFAKEHPDVSPIETIMRSAPVIPVLVIEDAAHAVPIAAALVAGGLPVLEVTLRTASALDVIREMKQVPGAIVGAGTVLNEYAISTTHWQQAASSSSRPASPMGWPRPRLHRARRSCPASPPAAISCAGLIWGLTGSSSFPAEANGGIPALKAISAPFGAVVLPDRRDHAASAPAWLALESGTVLRRFLAGPKGPARSGGDRSGGAGCGCAGAMTLLAELDARLQALHPRTAETPLFNPVFQLSLELSRQIESGDLSLDDRSRGWSRSWNAKACAPAPPTAALAVAPLGAA
jgi:2-dehydro-3-deoxyphosphogluconate aldolase/(4S)-4-hydroxy-2-oxoglutarate aldolase